MVTSYFITSSGSKNQIVRLLIPILLGNLYDMTAVKARCLFTVILMMLVYEIAMVYKQSIKNDTYMGCVNSNKLIY